MHSFHWLVCNCSALKNRKNGGISKTVFNMFYNLTKSSTLTLSKIREANKKGVLLKIVIVLLKVEKKKETIR